MRQAADGSLKLTDEEVRNGWDEPSVLAYAAERDRAAGYLVPGNVVTSFVRPRAPVRVENCRTFNPHQHWR